MPPYSTVSSKVFTAQKSCDQTVISAETPHTLLSKTKSELTLTTKIVYELTEVLIYTMDS